MSELLKHLIKQVVALHALRLDEAVKFGKQIEMHIRSNSIQKVNSDKC